jgi:hypothetical protein
MGIDINCEDCKFEGKQCFSYRRELLDALRAYLKKNKENHELELKYINWFYRDIKDDEERVLTITHEDEQKAIQLLQEKKLDGLFCWIFLQQQDYISYTTAEEFLESYKKIKSFIKDRFIDLNILAHAVQNKHNLKCW